MSSPDLAPARARAATFPERAAAEQCTTSLTATASVNSTSISDPTSSSPPPRALSLSSNSKQAYATEIVKALFGGSVVGDVVQDFSCSFQRQSGRLYVSTCGLFFYSNLFGFEKKVRINYGQALGITKLRTTSLCVKTVEGEEFIFRSFDDREHVLGIILGYHPSGEEMGSTNENTNTPPSPTPALGEEEEVNAAASDRSIDDTNSSRDLRPEDSQINDHKEKIERSVGSNAANPADESDENNAKQWEKMKQNGKGWHCAVVDFKVACKSAEDFFALFLGDNANHSLKKFCIAIGDENISVGVWKASDEARTTNANKSLSRMIQLDRNAGVQTAKVSRQQTYQCFGNNACLKNTTSIKGIKGLPSDLFCVEDMWLIEGFGNEGIILNIKFCVNFTKSTMLKSIIQNRTKAETKDHYSKYILFLQQKTRQKSIIQEEAFVPPAVTSQPEVDWFGILVTSMHQYFSDLSISFQNIPTSVLFIGFALVVYRLKIRIMTVEGIVEDFEQRLFELEKSQFDKPLIAALN